MKNQAIEKYLRKSCYVSTNKVDIVQEQVNKFIFVFLFIVILQPYITHDLSLMPRVQVAFSTAFIFSLISLIFHLFYNKKINVEHWNNKKNLILHSKLFLLETIVFMLYAYFSVRYLYKYAISGSMISVLINCVLYVLIGGFFTHIVLAYINNIKLHTIIKPEGEIVFEGKNKNEFVNANLQNIIYVKSIGHYTKIFLKSDDDNGDEKIHIKIIRSDMRTVSKLFDRYDYFFKCHRSYIINLKMLLKIEGNSRKAFAVLSYDNQCIPIARKNYKHIKYLLEQQ
ncbi:MAG: LytTR family transcriptional regulator [Flavobacteriaceae bacterium]|nr:LytTR family transcriptional regulator [Flavobacteriaceae bacterium]